MKFGDVKEAEIFRALATQSTYKVGVAFNFDKVYKDTRAVRNAVTAIFNKVKNNPEKYGVSQEIVDLVCNSMAERKALLVGTTAPTLAEKVDFTRDIKDVVTGIRDKTFSLIDKKLDRVKNSSKKLDAISFKDLGIIAGISFDKSQILRGEATENIAVLSQVDKNLPAGEVLKLALQMREKSVDENSGR